MMVCQQVKVQFHLPIGGFDPGYYRANYYDELNPKYGKNWKLYYYDYMCYGKASGKVVDDLISTEAEEHYYND